MKFSHMQLDSDKLSWQGAQIPFIGWDELPHFEQSQFVYLLSRNRSTCGVRPYVRATCNPDPDSWVKEWIKWWLDDNGDPIPERSGIVRWFARNGDNIEWADSKEELEKRGMLPKSFTFIPSKIHDNKILMDADPGYIANLQAMLPHERAALLGGNWNTRAVAGSYFRRQWVEVVDAAPAGDHEIHYWDRAATEPTAANNDPDWTAGVHVRKVNGIYYVLNVLRDRVTPMKVAQMIRNYASQHPDCHIGIEQDPAQAGVAEAMYLTRELAGYSVKTFNVTKSKALRLRPFSCQAQAGNVKVVRGKWNEDYFRELEQFTGDQDGHDDQCDGTSGAFNFLSGGDEPRVRNL